MRARTAITNDQFSILNSQSPRESLVTRTSRGRALTTCGLGRPRSYFLRPLNRSISFEAGLELVAGLLVFDEPWVPSNPPNLSSALPASLPTLPGRSEEHTSELQ